MQYGICYEFDIYWRQMTITCMSFHRIESMVLEGATNWTCQAAPKQDPQAWLYLQKGTCPQ